MHRNRIEKQKPTPKLIFVGEFKTPSVPPRYEEKAHEELGETLDSVLKDRPITRSLEVLYQLCQGLCNYGFASNLSKLIHAKCDDYAIERFEELAQFKSIGIEFLEDFHVFWKDYCEKISQIRQIFLHLDRTYKDIWVIIGEIIERCFRLHPTIYAKLEPAILDLLDMERAGRAVAQEFLKTNILMVIKTNMYDSDFESELLARTGRFYDREAGVLLASISVFDYLRHVDIRVHQETVLRVEKYTYESAKEELRWVVEYEMITERGEEIVSKFFDYYYKTVNLFQDDDLENFSLLYTLLNRVNELDICADYFTAFVMESTALLYPKSSVEETIVAVSLFVSQTTEIVEHIFQNNPLFVKGLNFACDHFVNLGQNNVLDLLVEYFDGITKQALFDETLVRQGLNLLKYISAKERFHVRYKDSLAKRLLANASNMDIEKLVLYRIRRECGIGFTRSLYRMLRDIDTSADIMKEYKNIENDDSILNVNLLTHVFWPSHKATQINLPPDLQGLQEKYNKFYTGKFTKRRLTWVNFLSTCEIDVHYPRGKERITLTLAETTVLLLFNDNTRLSYTDILNGTQLDEHELKRALLSLTSPVQQLLTKYPTEYYDIQPTDMFECHP